MIICDDFFPLTHKVFRCNFLPSDEGFLVIFFITVIFLNRIVISLRNQLFERANLQDFEKRLWGNKKNAYQLLHNCQGRELIFLEKFTHSNHPQLRQRRNIIAQSAISLPQRGNITVRKDNITA